MGFSWFKKKDKKAKKPDEVVFQNIEPQEGFSLQSQERTLTEVRDSDIEDFLRDMFITPDQFIILNAPQAQNRVRYIQATVVGGEIDLELAIEAEDGTRLFCKECSREECRRVFFDFYENRFVPDMAEYEPLKF